MIHRLGASLLVDDSLENAFDIATSSLLRPPSVPVQIPCLLFGAYEWNKRLSSSDKTDSYEQVRAKGGDIEGLDGLVRDEDLPEGIRRVSGWEEVGEWIRGEWERKGKGEVKA